MNKTTARTLVSTARSLLEAAWNRDTSVTPDQWTPDRPSIGQCAVTALIVQEWLGGSILRVSLRDGSTHYWNRLEDGTDVDLTRDQFDTFDPAGDPDTRTVYELLAHEGTARRWRLLRDRFETIA